MTEGRQAQRVCAGDMWHVRRRTRPGGQGLVTEEEEEEEEEEEGLFRLTQ